MGKFHWSGSIILILILLSTSLVLSQTDVYVAATTKWIFGIDDNLSIVWKVPNRGFSIACWADQLFVAINGYDVPAKLFVAKNENGKIIWSDSLKGIPLSYGQSKDSLGNYILTLGIEIGDSMRNEIRNLATGKLIETKTHFKERKSNKPSACPLPQPGDTLTLFHTTKYICSISPELSIIWHEDFLPNEHYSGQYQNHGILMSKNNIRILDKNSGAQMWTRSFKNEIRSTSMGAKIILSFANGMKDTLDIRNGESKTKR